MGQRKALDDNYRAANSYRPDLVLVLQEARSDLGFVAPRASRKSPLKRRTLLHPGSVLAFQWLVRTAVRQRNVCLCSGFRLFLVDGFGTGPGSDPIRRLFFRLYSAKTWRVVSYHTVPS